jgi:hypothetical protein
VGSVAPLSRAAPLADSVRYRGPVAEGVLAGAAGAVLGGIPSTLHALAAGRDPLEATYAAGSILLPGEPRRGRLLISATVAHGALSLIWGVALARALPRRHPVLAGAVAGLVIAAVDLGTVGRRIDRIRRLPLGPQLADHVAFGATVGAVLARQRVDSLEPGPPPLARS